MFIPPNKISGDLKSKQNEKSEVCLRSSYLVVKSDIAQSAFGESQNIYIVYYPNQRKIMMASVENDLFKQLHKTSQRMLKDRSLDGDKSITLHEILMDNDIDDTDRALEYTLEEGLGILSVHF